MAPTKKKVAVVTLSTRKPRVGPEVAKIVTAAIAPDAAAADIELAPLDLADFNLPLYDEEILPAMVPAHGQYQHAHTKAWTSAIAAHDGYVLVIPEYNYGVAGATKNAVDYLYNEWIGKPVAVVSYGITGGTNASTAIKATLEGMKLRLAPTRPALKFEKGADPGEMFAAIGKGIVGEETRKVWEGEAVAAEIQKAFGEVKKELLGELEAELPADPEKAGEKA